MASPADFTLASSHNFGSQLMNDISLSLFIYNLYVYMLYMGFPGGSDGKASACNTGDLGSIPGLGRSLGEGKGYPLQYSCLENPMDGGAW